MPAAQRGDPRRRVAFVYILECEGGWLYTGVTDDLLRRWREHQRGGSRFTTGRPALRVIHVEPHDTRAAAEKRERQLKRWTRAKKWALASGDLDQLRRL